MKIRNKVLRLATVGCFALSLTSAAVAEPAFITAVDFASIDPNDDSTARYIVRYKDGATGAIQNGVQSAPAFSIQQAETFARKYKSKVVKHLHSVRSSVLKLNPHQLKAMVSEPEVQYIEVDQKRYLFDVITPMAQSSPYGIALVPANLVNDANAASSKVCVIDTGYTLNHPDLPHTGVSGFAFSGHGN